MEEFALVFRHLAGDNLPTPEQLKVNLPLWDDWAAGIAAQGKFVTTRRLAFGGKVLKASGVVTDGPFVEVKEQLGGFMIVRAENIDEAITLAHGCPIFDIGGTVEVRPFAATNQAILAMENGE
ncbi:YciI family protein [Flavitalea sp. BT771]|uniref:YciI family protein n=1 Tax=Flavitalea sp. BT771 TaxID=3063329 RepID=UPI0026E137C8|nr:YciI family protein [Flavitalea sp. BT771]MDO6432648.1 YciI family protein [Flavitalea sp. BT771]MDV6222076.1 YciI family protein [Flavitalea sp. BT771]